MKLDPALLNWIYIYMDYIYNDSYASSTSILFLWLQNDAIDNAARPASRSPSWSPAIGRSLLLVPLFRAGAQNNIRGKWWFYHHILGLFLGKAVKAKYHKMCVYIYIIYIYINVVSWGILVVEISRLTIGDAVISCRRCWLMSPSCQRSPSSSPSSCRYRQNLKGPTWSNRFASLSACIISCPHEPSSTSAMTPAGTPETALPGRNSSSACPPWPWQCSCLGRSLW